MHPTRTFVQEDIYDYGLYLINRALNVADYNLARLDSPPLSVSLLPKQNWDEIAGNRYIAAQLNYNPDQQRTEAETNLNRMNTDQRAAYDQIMGAYRSGESRLFFLEGPAGTGKTFVYQTVAASVRAEQKIVLCVASSGIAALLLPGGRTAHSTLKIPIDIHAESTCNIPKSGEIASLLRQTKILI
ncbi:hypothetical protein SISSUDRAFT_995110, partial [Sistotremastrum suecicum HHB10207 ss-3]